MADPNGMWEWQERDVKKSRCETDPNHLNLCNPPFGGFRNLWIVDSTPSQPKKTWIHSYHAKGNTRKSSSVPCFNLFLLRLRSKRTWTCCQQVFQRDFWWLRGLNEDIYLFASLPVGLSYVFLLGHHIAWPKGGCMWDGPVGKLEYLRCMCNSWVMGVFFHT